MYKLIFALLILTFPLNALGKALCCQSSQKKISEAHKPCHDKNLKPSENTDTTCQNICIFCVNCTFLIHGEYSLSNLNSGLEKTVFASSVNSRSIKPPLKPPKPSELVFLINTNSIWIKEKNHVQKTFTIRSRSVLSRMCWNRRNNTFDLFTLSKAMLRALWRLWKLRMRLCWQ